MLVAMCKGQGKLWMVFRFQSMWFPSVYNQSPSDGSWNQEKLSLHLCLSAHHSWEFTNYCGLSGLGLI